MTGIRSIAILAGLLLLAACESTGRPAGEETVVRVATFNIRELSGEKLDRRGDDGRFDHPQLLNAAAIIRRVRPDVLLVNEIDFDAERRENARLFVERFLRSERPGLEPLDYPEIFFEPVNTGEPSGRDLDKDGASDGPADAHGFGRYPGQYGMAILSRFPIDREGARTFRHLRWAAMPGARLPDGRDGRPAFYDAGDREILRLSSKSHWDVPVLVGGHRLHVLASHPTPPVFDGPEDRNGRRNADEIRFWADHLSGGAVAGYIVDDEGRSGGLAPEASFVVLGDLNADPHGVRVGNGPAIAALLEHPRVRDPRPRGAGGVEVSRPYEGEAAEQTSDYGRLDYVLPSRDLVIEGSGVFWPRAADPEGGLMHGDDAASDHALVWVDFRFD
ncbi:MAG: endonuclease/exonuclease/phosphatase family protein [Planctomycetota bacterium]